MQATFFAECHWIPVLIHISSLKLSEVISQKPQHVCQKYEDTGISHPYVSSPSICPKFVSKHLSRMSLCAVALQINSQKRWLRVLYIFSFAPPVLITLHKTTYTAVNMFIRNIRYLFVSSTSISNVQTSKLVLKFYDFSKSEPRSVFLCFWGISIVMCMTVAYIWHVAQNKMSPQCQNCYAFPSWWGYLVHSIC